MDAAQTYFDYCLPPGDFLTVKQIAAVCGFSEQHVINAFAEGKVMGFESNGRATRGKEARWARRIPRKFAILYLASCANFDPGMLLDAVKAVIDTNSREMALQLQKHCALRLQRYN